MNSKSISYSALKLLEHEFQVAWASRDLKECIHILEKVLKLNPRSANAHLQMARVYGMVYEYDQAIESLENAVKVSPREQRALVLIEAGRTAREFFDTSIAESFFREAVEATGTIRGKHVGSDALQAKLAMADFSIRVRRRDLASRLVDEVLGTNPTDKGALLLWTQLNEDQFERCVERLEMLQRGDSPDLRVKAAYQLAKILDKAGDYDGAMQALVKAKSCMMGARDPVVTHRLRIRTQMRDLLAGFTEAKHAEWRGILPDLGEPERIVLLGGHPRSGTTLLEQVLDSHPDVISAEESENLSNCFYCPVMKREGLMSSIVSALERCSVDELKAYRRDYLEAMEKCVQQPVGSRVLVDKNPSLTPLAPVLFRLFPEVRYLTMIRDPRDVVMSCFMQPFFPPDVISGNFLTIADTAAEVNFLMCVWADLRQRFNGGFCEVRYEEMVDDLEANARKALEFLGLDWSEDVMDYDQHAGRKVVRSPTADAVTEKVHKRARNRWKNYEKHLGAAFEILAPCMAAHGYQ